LDDDQDLNALIFQVDLFSARGDMPENLDEVLERAKDIQYSSKTRFNTNKMKEIEMGGEALRRFLKKMPAHLRHDPDFKLLENRARGRRVSIVHLINRRFEYS